MCPPVASPTRRKRDKRSTPNSRTFVPAPGSCRSAPPPGTIRIHARGWSAPRTASHTQEITKELIRPAVPKMPEPPTRPTPQKASLLKPAAAKPAVAATTPPSKEKYDTADTDSDRDKDPEQKDKQIDSQPASHNEQAPPPDQGGGSGGSESSLQDTYSQ